MEVSQLQDISEHILTLACLYTYGFHIIFSTLFLLLMRIDTGIPSCADETSFLVWLNVFSLRAFIIFGESKINQMNYINLSAHS